MWVSLMPPAVWQLGDEDCILPSKLQAALQQILEEREDILSHVDADGCEGQCTADGLGLSFEPLVTVQPWVFLTRVFVQISRLTWALWCRRGSYGSSWSWWATTRSTWPSHPAGAGSCSATVSANRTRPGGSASSCSSSWTLRCLRASFRTRSCAREEEEVTYRSVLCAYLKKKKSFSFYDFMKPVKKKILIKMYNSFFEMHQRLREVEVILLIKKENICIYSYCPSRQDLDLFCYPFFLFLWLYFFFYNTQNSPQVRRV